jgi:anti-anti-sigma factor
MQITARTINNGTVLELNGRLVLGGDLIDLRNAVRNAAGKHPSRIVLNLAKVTDVDFCSIGELVRAFTHIQNRGGNLVLMNLPRRIRILLDKAQLTNVFEVSDREQVAITDTKLQLPFHQLCY